MAKEVKGANGVKEEKEAKEGKEVREVEEANRAKEGKGVNLESMVKGVGMAKEGKVRESQVKLVEEKEKGQ